MAKYLIKASYSPSGLKGLMDAGGTSRVNAVEKALTGVGGSIESFYFAFGADDVYAIVDGPDNVGAMTMAATIGSTGAISSYETVVLMSPADVDTAMRATVDYVPPGT
jgi:uncharacterized protein with GYD domain